jgi:tripartite-type tricarboxylate transporter receptor subunit TctC
VLQRLEAELQKAMATTAIKDRMATLGAMPRVQHAAGFAQVIQSETRRWALKPGSAGAAAAAAGLAPSGSITTAQKP